MRSTAPITVPEMVIRTIMLTRSSIIEYPSSRVRPTLATVDSLTESSEGKSLVSTDGRLRDLRDVADRSADDGGHGDLFQICGRLPHRPHAFVKPAVRFLNAHGRQESSIGIQVVDVLVNRGGGTRAAANGQPGSDAWSRRKGPRVS